MKVKSQTIRENLYSGAVSGVMAWMVYSIVECSFSVILGWIIYPSYEYIPLHWGFTVLLFGLYPVIGVITGVLSGILFTLTRKRISFLTELQPIRFFPLFSMFTVLAGYVVNCIVNYYGASPIFLLPPLSISFLVFTLLVLSATSKNWFCRIRFLTNPWTASILLLGLPWVAREVFRNSSLTLKAMGALAYLALIFLISFFLKKGMQKYRIDKPNSSAPTNAVKPLLYLALAVFAVLGISLFLNQEPLTATQNPMSDALAPNRPNVILVTLDTVRADHLSLYGYERNTSPNLKRFSEQATLYTRAIAPSDMTLPSHASIFTGLYAKKHRAHFDPPHLLLGRPLKDRFHTIAESLSVNGYTAMGVVANHGFLSRQFGFHQGFEYYDQRVPVPFLGFTKAYYIRQGIRNILIRFFPLRYFEPVYRNAEKINEQVFSLLYRVRQKENRPIFLFVNYMDAHWPYIPPDPFDKLYPGKIERYTSAHYVSMQSQVLKLDRKVTQKERSHLVSQYDGEIVYLDAQLGNLFKKIKDLGLYDNSIIIITSDHGEAFGERGFVGHINSVYQDQVWVPLIIKYPKISRKAVVHDLVSLIDLMPTVLDVLNFPIPSNIDGISLLKQSKDKSRPIIAESYPGDLRWNLHPRFERTECAIFSEPYKFITSTSGKRELYNLSKDPTEKEDLSVSDREISRKLEAEMNQWVNSAESADTEAASAPKFDTDTINRLKSLGYLR